MRPHIVEKKGSWRREMGVILETRRAPTEMGRSIEGGLSWWVGYLLCSASIQERASEKIDGYLGVMLGGGSEPGQIGGASLVSSGVKAAEPDDQVAQGGQIIGGMSGANGGAILAKGDITDVVKWVFDGPVTAAEGLDLSGVHCGGGTTGEEDFGLFGDTTVLEMMSGAADHNGLGGVRESSGLRGDFEGIDFTGLMSAVTLVEGDVRREKRRRSWPWRAWRVYRRAWVDWL
jgi:hypothetical protein